MPLSLVWPSRVSHARWVQYSTRRVHQPHVSSTSMHNITTAATQRKRGPAAAQQATLSPLRATYCACSASHHRRVVRLKCCTGACSEAALGVGFGTRCGTDRGWSSCGVRFCQACGGPPCPCYPRTRWWISGSARGPRVSCSVVSPGVQAAMYVAAHVKLVDGWRAACVLPLDLQQRPASCPHERSGGTW